MDEGRYDVGELASLGGVSRRTVRYYVQEGLLEPPLSLGRGARYTEEHLQRLLKVKELQERGLRLDEVRSALERPQGDRESGRSPGIPGPVRRSEAAPSPRREVLTRIELAPGVELLVDGRHRLPSPGRLRELSDWCRRSFQKETGGDDVEDDD